MAAGLHSARDNKEYAMVKETMVTCQNPDARPFRPVCTRSTWLGWLIASIIWAVLPGTLQAQRLSYHYVSFHAAKLPAGFISFGPSTIDDDGRVYGYACDDNDCIRSHVAFYDRGVVTAIAAEGFATAANKHGL